MRNISKKLLLGVGFSTALVWSAEAVAASSFVVKDIKVTGLHRVKSGTVLNYLPVQIGESVSSDSTAEIIRALYDTGFFKSVALEKKGNTLIVKVVERETIGSIEVIGNKEIPKEQLKPLLKQLGLVKGQVFQYSALDRLKKDLKQGYNARGRYNARITTSVKPLTENRVAIHVTVSEGRISRIKDIKITGNHDFPEHVLLSQLSLSSSGWLTYFSKKDQYTKTGMDASLEALRSFYLDRGYLKFKIISSQVMLSPDKKAVYINIHINEGPQYHFSGYDILGNTIIPREKLDALISIRKSEVFSRKQVTDSISALGQEYGNIGYGFPAINAEPKIDDVNKTVFITFVIEPGRHVYVRRINFHGNTKTGDYVLRNIIKQNEGALLSLHNVKESERQLRVLGYLKNIDIKTNPVPEANNQVDLDVNLEEAPSAEASASVAWGSNGPQASASFNQHNFMGTGRSVGLAVNASLWGQNYTFNYYNPFYSPNGIGRGLNLYYQHVKPNDNLDVARYNADRYGVDINYNILLGERSSLQAGIGYQDLDIKQVGPVTQIQNFIDLNGSKFHQIRLSGGWNRNSYDTLPFPNSGLNQQFVVLLALPADSQSLSYYKASYQAHLFYPLIKGFTLSLIGNLGYGNTFNQQGLPFYENYMAGGIAKPGMVRGYQSFTLGPKDSMDNAMGGNFLASASAALILPYPLSRDTVRSSVFVDAGNVFSIDTLPELSGGPAGPLRYSAGVAVDWRSPFGPLSFSVAKPIHKQPGDIEEVFQFTVSSAF